jgi:hypothetical protein
MALSRVLERHLRGCHGFAVVNIDGSPIGTFETPVFHGAALEPDFLIIRATDSMQGTFRVVSTAFVDDVEVERCVVSVAITSDEFARLPEGLPFANRHQSERTT